MDDLDRLYYEFVEILRTERDEALTDPLTVKELHDRLIPYRRVRNSVGFRSNDHYEVAFSRLLSGERGYLLGDTKMQQRVRAGLEERLPDLHRYRRFTESEVWINPAEVPPPGDTRYAPPDVREREGRGRASGALDEEATEAKGREAAAGAATERRARPEVELRPETETEAGREVTVQPKTKGAMSAAPEAAPGEGVRARASGCRECAAVELPERAVYCPYCGSALLELCQSCSAELESDWRFCAECGRSRGKR